MHCRSVNSSLLAEPCLCLRDATFRRHLVALHYYSNPSQQASDVDIAPATTRLDCCYCYYATRYATPPMPFVVVDLSPSQPRLFPSSPSLAGKQSEWTCMRACVGEAGSSIAYLALSGALQAKIEPRAFTHFKPLPSLQLPNHYASHHHLPNTQPASSLSDYTAGPA
jgi:hypothetical protein